MFFPENAGRVFSPQLPEENPHAETRHLLKHERDANS
jgi:hypothetical protein